jgi:hypothetical protein
LSSPAFEKSSFTPDEARGTALVVAAWLGRERFDVKLEEGLDGAPYRTTLRARNAGLDFLVEAQGTPQFAAGLQELATWLLVERKYAQLYVAVSATDEAVLSGRMLGQLKNHGCGLLLVTEQDVEVAFEAWNGALIVTPEPTLTFGHCKREVGDVVIRFNRGERKSALRDMCELVERETNALARKAARKGWIDKTESIVAGMDFNTKINVLASKAR